MKKILSICIPTYKRSTSLCKCINSITTQIDKFGLENDVYIYVANDASPDDTLSALKIYNDKKYFKIITREKNLGMNVNIKHMLYEIMNYSEYQLIITDDDYLKDNTLLDIINFLKSQQLTNSNNTPVFWTPRHSYTEDGKLHCIICNPFDRDAHINGTSKNVGKFMQNGFVLSGLILKAKYIDYNFWDEYKENAYFPMIFFGDLLLRHGASYWNQGIVSHTVLNECHWERWGQNDAVIKMRLFTDSVNAFGIMAQRLSGSFEKLKFYMSSLPSISQYVHFFTSSENLITEKNITLNAIWELKQKGFHWHNYSIKTLVILTLLFNTFNAAIKFLVLQILTITNFDKNKRLYHKKRANTYLCQLKTLPLSSRLIF